MSQLVYTKRSVLPLLKTFCFTDPPLVVSNPHPPLPPTPYPWIKQVTITGLELNVKSQSTDQVKFRLTVLTRSTLRYL